MSIDKIRKELSKRLLALEKERDKLRELESEVADHADRVSDSVDSLRYAIDRLSEVV